MRPDSMNTTPNDTVNPGAYWVKLPLWDHPQKINRTLRYECRKVTTQKDKWSKRKLGTTPNPSDAPRLLSFTFFKANAALNDIGEK